MICLIAAALALVQAPSLQFDVATIKPSDPGEMAKPNSRSYGNSGLGKYVAKNTPLMFMIEQAYGIRSRLILGAPEWVASDGYDILARAEVGPEETAAAPRSPVTHMFAPDNLRLQALLEDRFGLKVRRENRELPVYALTVAKEGLKVRPADCPSPGPVCGSAPYRQNRAAFKITAAGVTMATLLRALSNFSDRPLVDRTGYTEPFNAAIEWYDAESKYASGDDSPGPSLFTALREQLGVKIEPTKGPVEVLVIDRVERPSAN